MVVLVVRAIAIILNVIILILTILGKIPNILILILIIIRKIATSKGFRSAGKAKQIGSKTRGVQVADLESLNKYICVCIYFFFIVRIYIYNGTQRTPER